jgi:tetratricopeptide (TPR) repeat protein
MHGCLQLPQYRIRPGILACVLALCLLPTGCRKKPAAVSAPQMSAEAAAYVAQGDESMRDQHLFGWRKAEALYQKAYSLAGTDAIKNKLLLVRFLVLIRQIDEDIPYAAGDEVIQELCAGDPIQKTLCGIAEWFKNGKNAGQLKLNTPIFSGENPALESYLNLLFFQATPTVDAFPQLGDPLQASKQSPLFLYLNPHRLSSIDPAEFEKEYPQYAEGFQYIAESLSGKKKYRSARACFQKAIDLLPDYTRAMVGLGNIYYYTLEDYGQALRYYENAMERDSLNAAALFGKSLVLHQTGKYQDSNAVLDRMLAGNLARNKWVDGVPDAQYYQGQAHYLKAYNYYLMKNTIRARELLDSAKKFLPDSEEINYLSGLLFYELKDMESALRDFLRVVERGNYSNCNARLYLGLIYQQLKPAEIPSKEESERKSAQNFLSAATCMESAIGSMSYQIRTMDGMDLDPQELPALKARLEKRLLEMRESSCSSIEMIQREISKSSVAEKPVYQKYLGEILSRLREKQALP